VAVLVAPDRVEPIALAAIAVPVVPAVGADAVRAVAFVTVTLLVNAVVAVQVWYSAVILYLYVPPAGVSVQLKVPNSFGVPLLDATGLQEAAPRSFPAAS
jgi:hypothetical protein